MFDRMRIEVNITRFHAIAIILVLFLGFSSVFVLSGSSPIQGHTAEEIFPGVFVGGDYYSFPSDSGIQLKGILSCDQLGTDGSGKVICVGSGCSCSSWVDDVCGGGLCDPDEMYKVRSCTPAGCDSTHKCSSDPDCE